MDFQTVETGDLFRDDDPRGERVIQIRSGSVVRDGHVEAVTVAHWNESRIGRHTWISLDRLEWGRGYTKVEG